jgi:hypothetical protein
MSKRPRHDTDLLIELLGDRTRLNLPGPAPALPEPAHAPPRPTRRNRRRQLEFTEVGGEAHEHDGEFTCPACGAPGQLDIREGASGRCYLSCTSCFKMWQEVREPDKAMQLTYEAQWQLR